MKKTSDAQRLVLRKITIANLGQLTQAAGGLPRFTNQSVCAEQCCASDPNVNCPRTF